MGVRYKCFEPLSVTFSGESSGVGFGLSGLNFGSFGVKKLKMGVCLGV
jgi:hypothetical protein